MKMDVRDFKDLQRKLERLAEWPGMSNRRPEGVSELPGGEAGGQVQASDGGVAGWFVKSDEPSVLVRAERRKRGSFEREDRIAGERGISFTADGRKVEDLSFAHELGLRARCMRHDGIGECVRDAFLK